MPRPSVSLAAHRERILALAARFGAGNVRVFGSVARGDDGEGSDVDLLVTPSDRTGLLDLSAFADAVEDVIGAHVDVVSERGLSPYLRDRILRESRAL